MSEPVDLRARTLTYYQLVDAGDVDGVVDWFTPNGIYHRPGYPPMEGADALREFYSGERVIESGQHHVDAVIVDGVRAAVYGRFVGRLKDGTAVSVGFADFLVYDHADGAQAPAADGAARVIERRTYFDSPAV